MKTRMLDDVWKTIYFIQQLIKRDDNLKDCIHIKFDYRK